jgi:hypothetical protein
MNRKPTIAGRGVTRGIQRRIVVSFDDETFDQIRDKAVAEGVSFAEVVRQLVENGLEDVE